jgi:hypothetical protein
MLAENPQSGKNRKLPVERDGRERPSFLRILALEKLRQLARIAMDSLLGFDLGPEALFVDHFFHPSV